MHSRSRAGLPYKAHRFRYRMMCWMCFLRLRYRMMRWMCCLRLRYRLMRRMCCLRLRYRMMRRFSLIGRLYNSLSSVSCRVPMRYVPGFCVPRRCLAVRTSRRLISPRTPPPVHRAVAVCSLSRRRSQVLLLLFSYSPRYGFSLRRSCLRSRLMRCNMPVSPHPAALRPSRKP